MRKFNRLLSAALAVMMLGSSFSGSVNALGAENADTGDTSVIFDAAGVGWTADNETAAEEEPETEGIAEAEAVTDAEEADADLSDAQTEDAAADHKQDKTAPVQSEETAHADEDEQGTEDASGDIVEGTSVADDTSNEHEEETVETDDAVSMGNIYFVIDGKGGALDINSSDGNALLSAWTGEDFLSVTDAYSDTAKVTPDGVTVSDSDENSIYTGDSLMLDAEGFFALEQDGIVYIVENGELRKASEEETGSFTESYISYGGGSARICLTGEENASVSYAVRAKDGFKNSTHEVPSNTELSENEDILYGTAVFTGTSADNSNTYRFSFDAVKEAEDTSADIKASDKKQNAADNEISVQTEEETVTKEAADAVLQNGYDFSVTYDANGGIFDNGSDKNTIVYHVPNRYVSKTDNVSDDGEKTGPYAAKLERTDVVQIEGAEKLYVKITYQTENGRDWVCIYGGGVTPGAYNSYQSISGDLSGEGINTKTYVIDGDTVQFFFKSNSSRSDYFGYYAQVSESPFPEPEQEGFKIPSKNGFGFLSWNTIADGSGVTVDPKNIITASDMILYAQYSTNRIAVRFEDGFTIVITEGESIDDYIAEHGSVINQQILKPVSFSIQTSYDMYDWNESSGGDLFGMTDGVGIYIQDENGKYITFNDRLEAEGVSDDATFCVVKGGEKIFLSEGDYTVSFKGEHEDSSGGRRIVPRSSLNWYNEMQALLFHASTRLIYDETLNVKGDRTAFDLKGVSTRPDMNFFFIDQLGDGLPQKVRFPLSNTGADDGYRFTRTEENGHVIYTFDMENGTEEWITLEPNKKTIVRNHPMGRDSLETRFSFKNWAKFYGGGTSIHTLVSNDDDITCINIYDSWTPECSFVLFNAEPIYEVQQYHKRAVRKDAVEAKFYLIADKNDSAQQKYVLDHYETYEYAGRTFSNVYIPRRELKSIDSTDEDTFINTDRGDFTVLIPSNIYGGSKEWYKLKPYDALDPNRSIEPQLCEYSAEKGYFYMDPYIYALYSGNSSREYEAYNTRTGLSYGNHTQQEYLYDTEIEDIGIRRRSDVRYKVSEQTIVNHQCPVLKKELLVNFTNKNYPFTIELYAKRDGVPVKITELTLKANEEIPLIPENITGLTYDDIRNGLYVKEKDPENMWGKIYTSAAYSGETDDTGMTLYRPYSSPQNDIPTIKVMNYRITEKLTVKKTVQDGTGEHTHRFKLTLWDEKDGVRYPINDYTTGSLTTDKNGEVYFDISTNNGEESQLDLWIPKGCHYKLEEASSTLGRYTVTKTNDAGIIGIEGAISTWTNSTNPCDIVISKTDINGHEIAGAQMKVSGRETGASADITPITWTSEEGKDKTIQLYPGTYTLHEEAAPGSGLYAKASDITFTVDAEGKVKVADEDVDKVTMVDEYAFHDVVISKTDVGGHEIVGAQLKITGREEGASENITPIEWVSEDGKDRTVQLRPGTYTLHEEAVPDSNVYVQASDIGFVVTADGKVKVNGADVDKVTMIDEYVFHDVEMSKADVNGHEITGAQLKVTGRETGALTDITPITWTSENGKNKTVSLRPGTYTMSETAVPEGGVYVKAADIEFTVDINGNVRIADKDVDKVTMTDEYAFHDVVISKTDINGHEIAGAQMKVTGREEGASADITPVTWTSEDGKDKTISVRPGTYTLHEEAVPESGIYVKASDITFTVDKDGRVKVADKDVEKVTMVDEYNVSSLKVKKTVEGSLGSKDKQFSFTMTLKNADDTPYTKAVSYKKGTDTGTLTPSAEGKITFTLSHGDEAEFTGLVVGTKYTVEEADYSSEGYTVTKQNDTGTVAVQNPDVSFTNSRGAAVPTGTDIPVSGALALVVAACVGLAALAVKRRLMI